MMGSASKLCGAIAAVVVTVLTRHRRWWRMRRRSLYGIRVCAASSFLVSNRSAQNGGMEPKSSAPTHDKLDAAHVGIRHGDFHRLTRAGRTGHAPSHDATRGAP